MSGTPISTTRPAGPADATLPRYVHHIDGADAAPASGAYLPTDDPYTGQTWAWIARGNAADAAAAVDARIGPSRRGPGRR